MLARFQLRPLRHLLKERQSGRRQQRREILGRENLLAQRTQHIGRGVAVRVIGVHARNDLILNFRADVVHARLIRHVVGLGGDIFCGNDFGFFVFHDKYPSCPAQS